MVHTKMYHTTKMTASMAVTKENLLHKPQAILNLTTRIKNTKSTLPLMPTITVQTIRKYLRMLKIIQPVTTQQK